MDADLAFWDRAESRLRRRCPLFLTFARTDVDLWLPWGRFRLHMHPSTMHLELREMIQHRTRPKRNGGLIYISYAHADHRLAQGLAEELRRAHFEPWLDQETLEPGENWAKALGKALESSDAIVFLVSKSFLRSPNALNEWDFAISSPKHAGRVLPVLTPGTTIASAPWILKHIQHIRAGADWKRATRQVVTALRKLSHTD